VEVSQASEISIRMAETRRRQLSGSRKMAATRVRRRICLLRASQRLDVRRRLRTGSGKAKTVKALRQVVLHPGGELGCAAGVFFDHGGQLGVPPAPLRCASGTPGVRQSGRTTSTGRLLHYQTLEVGGREQHDVDHVLRDDCADLGQILVERLPAPLRLVIRVAKGAAHGPGAVTPKAMSAPLASAMTESLAPEGPCRMVAILRSRRFIREAAFYCSSLWNSISRKKSVFS